MKYQNKDNSKAISNIVYLRKSFNKFKDNNNKSHKVMKSCLRPYSSHHRNFQQSEIDFDLEKRNMNKKLYSKGYSQTDLFLFQHTQSMPIRSKDYLDSAWHSIFC
jgi:hypothetical protein